MGAKTVINTPKHYGLIGKKLAHSFSKGYFAEKFSALELSNYSYDDFEFQDESELADFLLDTVYKLDGFNVTIPYKEIIIPYLDELHEIADSVQVVNAVKIVNNKLIGYNTDIYGFIQAFRSDVKKSQKNALLLGTGGASKSVAFALESLGITVTFVSRNSEKAGVLSYSDIDCETMQSHQIIVNCTPVGTFPNSDEYPNIPYKYLTENHTVMDLIYNPTETLFLIKAKEKGARTKNGLSMLQFQADKAWEIWNS